MKLFLVGYMGSGKTSVGKKLADLYGFKWIDTDDWIEGRMCMTISEIFDKEGEHIFRQKEKECLDFLIDHNNLIISTGGGMPCINESIDVMNKMGETIYLKTPLDTLTSRLIKSKSYRPLLDVYRKEDTLKNYICKSFLNRALCYNRSKHIVDTHEKNIIQISQEIRTKIK